MTLVIVDRRAAAVCSVWDLIDNGTSGIKGNMSLRLPTVVSQRLQLRIAAYDVMCRGNESRIRCFKVIVIQR